VLGKAAVGSAAPAGPQMIVVGKTQNVSGPVTCAPAGNNVIIGVGNPVNGVGAVVNNDNPPIVHAVGLGSVDAVTLGFSDAAQGQGGNAGATVSGKYYQIEGTATDANTSNPGPRGCGRDGSNHELEVLGKAAIGNGC
jgi:lipoprotein LpqH